MSSSQQLLERSNRRLAFLRSDLLPSLAQDGSAAALGPGELDARAREVRADLVSLERAVVELQDLAEDADEAASRSTLLTQADMLKADVASARNEYRRSLMESAKSVDLVGAQRAALIPNASPAASDDPLQEKANQVTLALRKTTELMRAELDQSVMASQLLDESTQTIKTTNSLYEKYASLLDQSSHLIRLLERTNYWDRICILGGVAFFLCTCAWILKRRVVDKAVGGLASVVLGAGRLAGAGKAKKPPAAVPGAGGSTVVQVEGIPTEAVKEHAGLAKALEDAVPPEEGAALTEPVLEEEGLAAEAADVARARDEL